MDPYRYDIRYRYGRTTRDYSVELGRTRYVALIDEHVTSLVNDCNINRLESLILRGYDHVTDLEVVRKRRMGEHKGSKCSRQLEEVLADASKKQVGHHVGLLSCIEKKKI